MFENPNHIAIYRSIVDEINQVALTEEQSKVFIANQAAAFGN